MDDDSEVKKSKGTKKCVIKLEIMFKNYTDCLFNNKIILKSQQRFKSNHHKVYLEEVNNITLSSDDDKRLQTFNVIETYPYGTNAFKVCESEMMVMRNLFVKKYVDCPFYGKIVLKKIKISVFNVHVLKKKTIVALQHINDQF